MPFPCVRMQSVQSPIIPVVGDLIRETPGTISLGQGVVNYGPPPEACARVTSFFADPQNHKYKLVQGIPELIELIGSKLAAENGIHVGADTRIVVTAGGNMAFMNAVLAVTDPGDEVIIQLPYDFNHEMAIGIAGCRAVCVPTDNAYQLRPDLVRAAITPRTRAVVTISPNNPSGVVYSEQALREVNRLCAGNGLYHIVHTHMDTMVLVERLIREHRVAVIPGTTFGIKDGCYLRVAFGALEEHTVADGIDRLVTGLKTVVG